MLTASGSTSYQYDGGGNRIQQTVSSVVTDYLLDTQPSLTKVLAQTTGGNTDRFVHSPMGIHAQEDNSGNWTWPVQDGLGSVRGVVSNALAVNGMQNFDPIGNPFGAQGSLGLDFGFTGEQTDGTGQVYLRARYYNPSMGVFTALDPFEGMMQRPMSLNGYLWVEGNPVNWTDASGQISTQLELIVNSSLRELANMLNSAICLLNQGHVPVPECVKPTSCECEPCCWEKWRGEHPEIADEGMERCLSECFSNSAESVLFRVAPQNNVDW